MKFTLKFATAVALAVVAAGTALANAQGSDTSVSRPKTTFLFGPTGVKTDIGELMASPAYGDLGKSQSFGYSFGSLISWNFPFNGAARARVHENEAIAGRSLAQFDAAVLGALKETEQALARAGGATEHENRLTLALAASADAARLSQLRFDYGSDNFLQLLDAQRSDAAARAALAQAQADRANAQISVFKALGGGWEAAPVANPAQSSQ